MSSARRPAPDYYKILDIPENAEIKDINSAYKRLALRHHPDKVGGTDAAAHSEFQKIQEAVEVLRDPVRRAAHDDELSRARREAQLDQEFDQIFPGFQYQTQSYAQEASTAGCKVGAPIPYRNNPFWRPYHGGYYDRHSATARYMYSYRNSVHMDPYSLDSVQERMRAQQESKESAQLRRTWMEDQEQREARRRQAMRANVRRDEDRVRGESAVEEVVRGGSGIRTTKGSVASGDATFDDEEFSNAEYETAPLQSNTFDEDDDDDTVFFSFSGDESPEAVSSSEHDALHPEQAGREHHPKQEPSGPLFLNQITEEETPETPLAPFMPYFNAKLAHPGGRYTREDMHVEVQGLVMETFCGWLESLRLTVPGARPLETGLDPSHCTHQGFWTKHFECTECEVCHRWMPVYTLTCPGCGIKACVSCKFEDQDA